MFFGGFTLIVVNVVNSLAHYFIVEKVVIEKSIQEGSIDDFTRELIGVLSLPSYSSLPIDFTFFGDLIMSLERTEGKEPSSDILLAEDENPRASLTSRDYGLTRGSGETKESVVLRLGATNVSQVTLKEISQKKDQGKMSKLFQRNRFLKHNLIKVKIRLLLIQTVIPFLIIIAAVLVEQNLFELDTTYDEGLAALIAAYLLGISTLSLLRVSRILLNKKEPFVDLESLEESLLSLDGVSDLHMLHCFSNREGKAIGSVHIVIHDSELRDIIQLKAICLFRTHGIMHSTVQIETRECISLCHHNVFPNFY